MNDLDSTAESAATPSGDPSEAAAPVDLVTHSRLPFFVVGIGTSAGGIQALGAFLDATPPDSGMAYVIIQHLAPDRQSLIAEILSRRTAMPVHEIADGMPVEPNHVYVIRPGNTVTLLDGKLQLSEPVEQRGHRRPVDDFFRSLAREQKDKAIAVVLTGSGTNGTAGAQAIKAAGGLCIAQNPESADYAGMPNSLIQAGYADRVLDIAQIPPLLLRFIRHPYTAVAEQTLGPLQRDLEMRQQQLAEIVSIVRESTGHNFAPYKMSTVFRRIQRRMGLAGASDFSVYASRVREQREEAQALANDLMINVTGFFRDPPAWEALRDTVVRPMVEQRATGDSIRVWVIACASGEEAYSVAMLINEEAARVRKSFQVKIFATDTADRSVALARAGVYPGGIEGDLSPERLEQFFDKDDHTYRIKKHIREQVVFAPQDVLRDPPFSRVDLVTCRNLLIYLEPDAQRRTLTLIHFALCEGGYAFLGNAETTGQTHSLFDTLSKRWRIYRRSGRPAIAEMPALLTPPQVKRTPAAPPPTALARIGQPSPTVAIQLALLEKFGPPTAVVDAGERLVYFHGDAAPYLTIPAGESSQDLLGLVRIPLRPVVRRALREAAAQKRSVAVELIAPDAGGRVIRITAEPLLPARLSGHLRVTFEGYPDPLAASSAAIGQSPALLDAGGLASAFEPLEEEVRLLKHELQTSVEAFEVATEELKASNEEVTSVNEELQSANEELETGKEELQSLNEELTTVNTQLQIKIVELEAKTNDLNNLLSSTDIAVVFLDLNLRVRGFTPAISDLLELIPSDVGRPLVQLAQKFTDEQLMADTARVIARLVPSECEVRSHSGRWYLRRILPYRTEDQHIAGVVITFIDVSARKRAEQSIEAAQARLQSVIEQMPAAILMAEAPTGKLLLANRRASTLFGHHHPLPFVGAHWTAIYATFRGAHPDGRIYEPHEWPLARALSNAETVMDEELDFRRVDGTHATVAMSATPLYSSAGEVVGAVATFFDVTERNRAALALRESEERFRLLVKSARDFAIFMLDLDRRVVTWNPGAEKILGFSEAEILGSSGDLIFTPEDRSLGIPEQECRLAAEQGHAADERWHLRKDGSRFWASGVLAAARDSKNILRGYVKILRDQTAHRAFQAELQAALEAAESLREAAEGANRAKDDFISTVSHELRTPLNTIRLWSRMLASGKVPAAESMEGAKMVERAAIAQQQLIDDLLDVSRMASGKLRLAPREVRLAQVVLASIESVRPVAELRQVTLEVSLDREVGVVLADPDRIQQVVWNLLSNAVKFTPSGGKVGVEMRRIDESVQITVQDTGIGIRSEFLPYIFERFRQADSSSSRRHGGLGLGLAIAHQLVTLHGGTITAESEGEGRGTRFTVRLPKLERLVENEARDLLLRPLESDLRGIDILLVDDELATREATVRLLEQHGATVRSADSAAAARDALAIRQASLIIADIGLPGEDGYLFIRSIRQLETSQHTARIPAVAVTAFARPEDRQRALAAGFDDHLPKPLDPDRFIAAIAALSRQH